jgi:uncharacterized membrane protein
MSLHEQATEAAVTKAATAAQYVGSGGALVFGLTANQWSVLGIIAGIVIALLGFLVNWYYRDQHLRLARAQRVLWDAAREE